MTDAPTPCRPTLADLIRATADICRCGQMDVFCRSRLAASVAARSAFALAARKTGYSFPDIAQSLGKRSHSSIIYMARRGDAFTAGRIMAASA